MSEIERKNPVFPVKISKYASDKEKYINKILNESLVFMRKKYNLYYWVLPKNPVTILDNWGSYYVELHDAEFKKINSGESCKFVIYDSVDRSVEVHCIKNDFLCIEDHCVNC